MTAMLAGPSVTTYPDDSLTAHYTVATADGVELAVREYCPSYVEATILLLHGYAATPPTAGTTTPATAPITNLRFDRRTGPWTPCGQGPGGGL
ncbi:hypothetical protein [Mycolicibacterium sp. CBMA 226]|uniref:hypothetical protein n=1 Tax=Mycolicibacterium sp. CBMA 226 TaxID=2606611 RepID=UPI0012DCF71A|nr:hypothetical protein [Mycolicibacterium sp. CBMA 226]MUL78949.1 hypothetical protein [Mycolicibacterium sp. CBMA 226]QGW61259.1 hypothetical protein ICEMyc226_00227 [Mycolicibacterium sp.]